MLGVTRPLWEETWVWWAFNTGQKTLRREWANRARTGNTAWQWALTQQRLQAMLIANKLNWSLQVDTVFLVTAIGEQLPYLSFDLSAFSLLFVLLYPLFWDGRVRMDTWMPGCQLGPSHPNLIYTIPSVKAHFWRLSIIFKNRFYIIHRTFPYLCKSTRDM